MSTTFRWMVAIVGVLFAIGFLLTPLLFPTPGIKLGPLLLVAGVCLLISATCLPGRTGDAARRVVGGLIFLAYVSYLVSEIGKPLPPPGAYRRSDSNAINAALGLVFFGLPGAYYAWKGRFLPASSLSSNQKRRDGE